MAAATARVYYTLPTAERKQTAIFAKDYGEAAAIDFFGPAYRLPEAISPHQNYFLWGPRNYTGQSIILLGHNPTLEKQCSAEEQVGFFEHEYAMPYESFPILLCHDLRNPLKQVWPDLKRWE
jgi:hypothetical protein